MNLKNNPELIPLIEWWEKDGKSTVLCLIIAAAAVGGWYGYKAHVASVKEAASAAVVNAYTTDELEEAATRFAGKNVEGVIKVRLAKSYFDAARYEEALTIYEELIGKADAAFGDIALVGKAQCLEALKKFDDAVKAFDDFAAANPKNYLTLTAQLGAARAIAQAGDKKKALARTAAILAANKDDEFAKARVEATELAIKRL